jgi:plasmid stability protein
MKVVTLRNLSPELTRIIRRKAAEQGTSITKAVKGLLEEATGIRHTKQRQALYHDLDALAGTWTSEDAAAFEENLGRLRKVDPELWK